MQGRDEGTRSEPHAEFQPLQIWSKYSIHDLAVTTGKFEYCPKSRGCMVTGRKGRALSMKRAFAGLLPIVLLGFCALPGCSKGKCEACTKDADCAPGLTCHPQSRICKAPGNTAIECPGDCGVSKQCQEGGLCTFRNGKCVVATDEDCRRSEVCTGHGRCNRRDFGAFGECVGVNPEDCRKSTFCRTLGQCKMDSRLRECRAASDDDCAKAETCTRDQKCKAKDGVCVGS
jgi:hypothetical protein